MAALFDEIHKVSLQFSNPNRNEMLDADRIPVPLSSSFDSIVRKSLSTSRSVASVFKEIQKAQGAFSKAQDSPSKTGLDQNVLKQLQHTMAKYTEDRLGAMMQSVVARKEAFSTKNTAMADAFRKVESQVQNAIARSAKKLGDLASGQIGKVLMLDTEFTGRR